MKSTLRAAAAVVALALAAPVVAQQAPAHPRLGVGVSLNPSLIADLASTTGTLAPAPKLYVPFYVTPYIRIEPEIGWISVTNDASSTNDHAFDLGIGALVLKPMSQSTNLYGGLRLASIWLQNETRSGGGVLTRTTQRNTLLSFVGGAEYLPAAWFSIGVEAQLAFNFLGDQDRNVGGVTTTTSGGTAKAIQGLFFMRVYFL